MTKNRAIFLGSCMLIGAGVIAVPLGKLAEATNFIYGDCSFIPGAIAALVGLALAVKALIGMHSEDK